MPGPKAAPWKGRNKPRRRDRRWANAWSPEQIAQRLRRSDGFPGDFIGDLPVNAFIHPAGRPINTSKLEVCQRLPHQLTGALYASSGPCFTAAAISGEGVAPLLQATGSAIVTAAALLVVALALPGQLGLGDVALAGAIALSLGWLGVQAVIVGLLTGLVLQAAAAIAVRLRRTGNALTPMGLALLVGWLLGVVYATR